MIETPHSVQQPDVAPDTRLMPPTFDPAYVQGAIEPFFESASYQGELPLLPMIDLALSKEAAIPAHICGMLYEGWKPNMEQEGLSVFLQAYDQRGPQNERKRIYYSAQTPDLYAPMYSDKVNHFLDHLFDKKNEGRPLMQRYLQDYFDLYWDLHLGVTGKAIPSEVRQIGTSFMAVLGFWYPTLQVVHDNYMQVRQLRQGLKDWIDERVQDVIDGRIPHPEKTLVYYWVKNGKLGKHFRRKDIVFECFHNFLALSQWGNTLYNIMLCLQATNGNPAVCSWFEKTMTADPNAMDQCAFSRLDRFVMELFRTISPNAGSYSTLAARQHALGTGYTGFSGIFTPHLETSRDPRHWTNPNDFDPDRYKKATTSEKNDEAKCKAVGLARCPFEPHAWSVKDGRKAEISNSVFGAVYSRVEGQSYPVCDDAGYAPFGFGYRRCAGEFLTIGFVKDFLRKVWNEQIAFTRLTGDHAELLPVGPLTVVPDNIVFKKAK